MAKSANEGKLNQQLLDALRKALDGNVWRLQGPPTTPGLFPTGVGGLRLADQAIEEGFLEKVPPPESPAKKASKAKQPTFARITANGQQFVLNSDSPKKVLEELSSALERQRGDVGEGLKQLQHQVSTWQQGVESLHQSIAALLTQQQQSLRVVAETVQRVSQKPPVPAQAVVQNGPSSENWLDDVVKFVAEQKRRNSFSRPTLPQIFAELKKTRPALTLGQFHDGLRTLQRQKRIWLTAYTQALATLDDAQNALYLDREVKYYVDLS